MSKSGYKTPDFLSDVTSEDSTPHYARSTTESRNKRKKVQKNRISPSRSPRFCEDSDLPQVTCRNLEIKVSVYDHEPNLFTRSQSSNNARGVFNERLESEINFYKRKLSERDLEMERLRCNNRSNRLELDNKDLKQLLSEREKEIEELKETIENDKEVYRKHLLSKHKEIEKLKSNLNNDHKDCKKRLSVKDKEIEKLKGMVEVGNNRQKPKMFKYEEDKKKQSNIIKELEKQVKQNREEHDDLKRRKVEYEDKLQEYLEVILTSRDEKSRLTSELQKRVTENKKMRETSMEQQEKIKEHETTLEKMRMIVEKYKRINKSIMESNVEKEDRNRDLEIKLKHVEMMKEEISRRFEEISKDLQASEKDYKLLRIEFEKGNKRIKQLKEKECGINDLQMQLDAKMEENNRLTQHISRLEDFKSKYYMVKNDNKHVWENCLSLKRKFEDRMSELEVVSIELDRYSDRVTQLEEEIRNIKHLSAQERMFTEEKILQAELADNKLQIENLSRECEKQRRTGEKSEHEMTELKQVVQKKTNEVEELNKKIKDLSRQLTNGKRDKENAENQIDSLSNTLFHKRKELESVQNKLARSEEDVLILSKDIKDTQASRHLADEKLHGLQTENASLKSALSKATNEIDDLNKGTNLQKYKTDAEHKASKLMNALREKDTENEALREQAEKNVSILSKDFKDMQASKRQVAEEKLQSLQTENTSLKSALFKATNEIEDLVNKGTNLQKYKTDAEHKTSKLMNALREKDTENEALREQLARAEKNVSILSKDIKDMQASKRQVPKEKLQSLQTEIASLKSNLSKATNEIEDLVNKGTNLQKYNTDAEHKTSTLMNALREKDTENEALREQLARAEKNVSILSKDIKEMQASKRQVAEEKLQSLQTENASLKSALSKATNEIEDLLNKDTNLQKYKTDAEHKTSSLMNALKDKETEIEALSKQLARSEENVSILSKDIKNIQESKRQVADEKLQDLQTENDSLKLTLAEATTKIDDLWNKCTNLQKYKSDTELEIGTLLNVVEEKETEIETLHKHLARSEKNVSILSKDIKDIQGSKRQAADEKVQSLQTENASIKLELAKATTEIDAFRNKCTDLQKYKTDTEHTINSLLNAVKEKETKFEALNTQLARKNNELSKDKENAENQKNRLSKALDENKKEIETMQNDIARYKEKIWTLTKTVEDIKGSKNQAADENIKGLQKKIGSLESELRNATTEMNDLSYKYKCLQKDKESAEYTINKLSRNVQEKEKEISSLIEDLAKANENEDKEEHAASANSIQKLTDENASLRSKLSQLSHETEKKVSALTKEIKSLQKSKGTSSEEYNARKLYEENEFLKAQLDRTSRSYEQLRKDYNEVKREKDHALNRLSSVAGEKLRNNNPGIADLSDENRPINLGEKFSQLYDDQWTDAIEHLEEMGYSETEGIRRLLDILKGVFDECVRLSDIHFNQLKELTGTSHLPSDQLKKLKDLRKATAVHSVAKIKQVVNDYMSKAFSKEKAACQTYIDRSIELCWLMSVQDPPVVIDFIAVHGQAIDDKILRKFTKTGSKIDFLVWPVIRLHKNGPLLQKGVVQPI